MSWRKSKTTDLARASAAAIPVPRLEVTRVGWVFCLLAVFLLLASWNSQANLLFAMFGMMVGVLLVTPLIGRTVLRKLEVRRRLPESVAVGQTLAGAYELVNRKRFWPSFSVGIRELDAIPAFRTGLQAYMLHAAPKTAAVVPADALAARRGVYSLERCQVSTAFPFGLICRTAVLRDPAPLVIFPAVGKVAPQVLALCRSATQDVGRDVRPRQGGVDEFYGLKEYRPGESPRWIYWRKSARTGRLVLKEMTEISPPTLVLLVDTFLRERSRGAHAAVERAVAVAASLASHALASDLQVGLLAWTGQWKYLPPERGKRHRLELLTYLARLPLNREQNADALLARARLVAGRSASLVLLTPSDLHAPQAERRRSGLVVFGAASDEVARWFRFDPSVDFSTCMPADQDPEEPPRVDATGRADAVGAGVSRPAVAAGG